MVLRKAIQPCNASFNNKKKQLLRDHLPSRSISKTLMASCVLSGRTSLAGSVCLLWIPGETEGVGCIGLMKGCAPTTDIIRFHSLFTSNASLVSFSAPQQDHLCQVLRGQQDGLCPYLWDSFAGCDSPANLHLNI